MDIVVFLEARVAEEEATLHYAEPVGSPLVGSLREECAQKRAILEDWKCAAAAEGIADPGEAKSPFAVARRSMLRILAAGYKHHPDYASACREDASGGTGPNGMRAQHAADSRPVSLTAPC